MSFTLIEFMSVVELITDIMVSLTDGLDATILISTTTPNITLLDIPVLFMIYAELEMLINGLRE